MAIERWHPFRVGAVRDFDDLFNRFFTGRNRHAHNLVHHPVRSTVRTHAPDAWNIPVDVVQTDDGLLITASVPGTSKDDIDISVDENILTIRAESEKPVEVSPVDSDSDESDVPAPSSISTDYLLRERRTGSYYRALRLPKNVDYENAESIFKDGVLTIKLPTLESKKARKLEISAV